MTRRWSRILSGLVLLLSNALAAIGQNYGNEWIDYNKSYYKVAVADDGIHRLTFDDLVAAGVPVNSIPGNKYMLFHHGREQSIYIENSGASQIESGEYIEFYGKRNDGTLDSALYISPNDQPHKFYNLYSDTSVYFLTWETGAANGNRMSIFQKTNTVGLPASSSQDANSLQLFTSEYSVGHTESSYASRSGFDVGEGWTGVRVQEGSNADYIISGIARTVPADGSPQLDMLVVGRNDLSDHGIRIFVGASAASLRVIGTYALARFSTLSVQESLLWTDISGSGDVTVRLEVLINASTGLSNISASFIRVSFPQLWDQNSEASKTYGLRADPTDTTYIEISNTPLNARLYDITDPNNVGRIGYTGAPNQIDAIIPGTSADRELFVTQQNPLFASPQIKPVSFSNVDPASGDYIIISHPVLMKPAGSSNNAVSEYAAYRASAAGGGFDTLTVSILDLYNQYSYGEYTPLAVYNFMRRMVIQGNPAYLFIIGKALDIRYGFYRNPVSSFTYPDLVPVGGSPGSDIVYTAGLNGTEFEPAVPTGRITASTPADVINYLNKVKTKDAPTYDDLWPKRLLHLSGGLSASEKVEFENIVDGFASIAEGPFLGGDTRKVTKNTTNIVEFINVSEEVNNGVGFITFFGHSAPGITDIDIGTVSNPSFGYNNLDRYPVFMVNGCQAGDFFEDYINWGADWILAADKGAVGFMAHTSFGFASRLKLYTDLFYRVGFADSVYIIQTLGNVKSETARRFQALTTSTALNQAQVQQVVLIGDPAIKVFGTDLPDYETNDNQLFAVQPEEGPINTTTQEFDIGIITRNFGAAVDDSLTVTITRTFSDATDFNYDTLKFRGVYHQDTLLFTVSNDFSNSSGINQFKVDLNVDGSINEMNLTNNSGVLTLLIPENGTINLLPYDNALVGDQFVELISQSANLLTQQRTILYEFDSTTAFNSPLRMQNSIAAYELAKWEVGIPASGSTAYYWRTKYNQPQPGEEDEWEVTSLTYIPGSSPGWGQIHFPQFQDATADGIEADTIARQWNFETNETSLLIRTYGPNHPDFNYTDVDVEINNINYVFAGRLCRDNTINLIAFDKSTAFPYAALFTEIFFPTTCGRQVQVINNYNESEVSGTNDYLVNYVDAVPQNDQVVLFTVGQVNFSTWTPAILAKLEELGISSTDIQALADGEPVIIVGRKGSAPGSATFVKTSLTPVDEQEVMLSTQIMGQFTEGIIKSSVIGPALSWDALNVDLTSDPLADQYKFTVIGIQPDGVEVPLIENIVANSTGLTSIDASLYPKMRLAGWFQDEVDLSPPQLNSWVVTYETPPEGVLFFNESQLQLTVQEGESVSPSFSFLNVSDKAFSDSLSVEYSLFNQSSGTRTDYSLKISAPAPGDTTTFKTVFTTLALVGWNDFTVAVNLTGEAEQNTTNNIIQLLPYVEVDADQTNPLVDVTIDGERIFDGDLVSPTPLIRAEVRDSNPYLFLTDTTAADIFILRPCDGCILERINYSDPNVTWTAGNDKEPFVVEYTPGQLSNGVYLLEVQAKDATGNKAGAEPFQIHFEIVNESTITHFYPYPNPFSTSTRFIFTLTGSQIPDEIKIQIMTVSGKVVREITQDELGPIKIGNNITDFAWDGKDEFGDQLANGVYLYRVLARISGKPLDLRASGGDRGFSKGYGKLYLLR